MEKNSLDANTRFRRSAHATYQTVEGEAILIHMQTGTYYSLNDVGTAFWELLDGARTVGDCAAAIATEYDAPVDVITSDLLELAADLMKEGLVEKA
jgi:hypothetical protein